MVITLQIESEVASVLKMIADVYTTFGFTYELALSTRPAKYIGQLEVWDRAEAALRQGSVKLKSLLCDQKFWRKKQQILIAKKKKTSFGERWSRIHYR